MIAPKRDKLYQFATPLRRVVFLPSLFMLFVSWSAWAKEHRSSIHTVPSKCENILARARKETDGNRLKSASRSGKLLSDCYRIPGPPVKIMKLRQLDPPRRVPAQNWNSPICAKWHDKKYTCVQFDKTKQADCKIDADINQAAPDGVICTNTVPADKMGLYCKNIIYNEVYYRKDGSVQIRGLGESQWYHHFSIAENKWLNNFFDGVYTLPTRPDPNYLFSENDNRCVSAYSSRDLKNFDIEIRD